MDKPKEAGGEGRGFVDKSVLEDLERKILQYETALQHLRVHRDTVKARIEKKP